MVGVLWWWSGWPGCGASRANSVARSLGPRPVAVDPEVQSSAGAHQAGGDVQQPVAQRGGFAAGQLAVEAEGLHPGEQVGRGQREFEPDPLG